MINSKSVAIVGIVSIVLALGAAGIVMMTSQIANAIVENPPGKGKMGGGGPPTEICNKLNNMDVRPPPCGAKPIPIPSR